MIDAAATFVSSRLLAASLLAAVLVPVVWATCRLLRGLPAAGQAALWWLLALRILLAFLPLPALSLPILPFDAPLGLAQDGPAAADAPVAVELPALPVVSDEPASTWHRWMVVLWIGALLLHTVYLVAVYRRQRRAVARSVLLNPAATDVARLAAIMGVRRVPDVRASVEIDVPQVAGLVHPVVLLPAHFAEGLTPAERTMTLCHELAHIRRRDLAWGWVPVVFERLLFFHPLARFAAREYAAAREAACDAAVLRMLAVTPAEYGRLLLRLGVNVPTPTLAAGATSPSRSSLRRRLEMLYDSTNRSRASRWVLAAAVCAFIPLQLTARTPPAQEPAPAPSRAVQRVVQPAEMPSAVAVFEQETAKVVERAQAAAPAAIREAQELIRQAERDVRAAAEAQRADELRRELEIAELRMRDAIQRAVERKERLEQDSRRLVERRGAEVEARQADLRAQMDQLRGQLQALARQLMETAEQQKILEDAQRRVADQIEMLRRALETLRP